MTFRLLPSIAAKTQYHDVNTPIMQRRKFKYKEDLLVQKIQPEDLAEAMRFAALMHPRTRPDPENQATDLVRQCKQPACLTVFTTRGRWRPAPACGMTILREFAIVIPFRRTFA